MAKYSKLYGSARIFPSDKKQIMLIMAIKQAITEAVHAASASSLVGTDSEAAQNLAESVAPQLFWDAKIGWNQVEAEPLGEVDLPSVQGFAAKAQRVAFHVPVYGNPGLLSACQPAGPMFYHRGIAIEAAKSGQAEGDLIFTYDEASAQAAKQRYERDAESVKMGFANLTATFAHERTQILKMTEVAIAERRAELARQAQDVASLGMPIRRK